MERKIGEIFEYNGEWYQCVRGKSGEKCIGCSFKFSSICIYFHCLESERKDHLKVIFKKLEKVGEPYMLEDKKFQKYKILKTPYIYNKTDCSWQSFSDPYYVSLEIKQNKEDMEEKKLNLKPFDIQKAREGKPVCTRDGRKARIICFDAKMKRNIIALIQDNEFKDEEIAIEYFPNGCFYDNDFDTSLDLMMPPEKKEGWAKVRKDINLYDTKEEADRKMIGNDEYVTAKVCWEE